MGLFGSSDSGPAEELASQARGSTVTADRLTTTKKRIGESHLENKPLIELLRDDEQPQYWFYNRLGGINRDNDNIGKPTNEEATGGYFTICLVTDQRVLLITDGNLGGAIPHNSIHDVETECGLTKSRLSISTSNHKYDMPISRKVDNDEIEDAANYIRKQASKSSSDKPEFVRIGNLRNPWQSTSSERTADEGIATEPVGRYVTEEQFNKINDILDSDEKVHYITKGGTIDVEGSGAGSSAFGNDRDRKNSLSGNLRAVITDKRVAVKIPQVLGDDERSIPYDSITSVDLDTGLVNKRLTLQTAGQTYHIQATEPGKEELREAIRFIREKRKEANQNEVVVQQSDDSSEPDPLEQIEKLKGLKESGAISEDEFEEKKQELLDKI